MRDEKLLMGVDLGTTVLKVGLFDLDGNLVANSNGKYKLFSEHPMWVEEKPEDWWKTFKETTTKIKEAYLKNIEGICVGGQYPTLVSLDEKGEPIRPAITWMDRRAIYEAKVLSQKLNTPIDSSDLIPKIMWIKNNEKEKYERVKWFMQSFDYINYKLTGFPTFTTFLRDFPSCLLNRLVFQSISKHIAIVKIDKDKFPPNRLIGEIIGGVTSKASKETNLPMDTPVIGGLPDAYASMLGTGTVRKGRLCMIGGTSDVIILYWDKLLQDPLNRIISLPHIIKNQWTIGAMTSTSGKSLEWFRDNFDSSESYEEIISKTKDVEAGSNNLIFLPYLCGERCPIWDPNARGVFFGLSLQHSKFHLVKAILESIGYSLRQNMEIISELGGEITEIRLCGGQAKSDAWTQIKTDILGKEILIPKILNAELLGEAIIAGYGIGEFKNIEETAENFVKIKKIIRPREKNYERYSKLFNLYKKLYLDLKKAFRISGEERF